MPKMVSCEVHKDEEVKLFCKTCKILVCSECTVGQHVGHTFLSMKEKASEYSRNKISKVVDNVKSKTIPKLREMVKEAKETLEEHSKDGSLVENGINGRRDELTLQICKAREELLQEIEMLQSTDTKKLKDFEQKLEAALHDAEELLNAYSDDLGTAQDARIIKLEYDMVKKVSEMEKEIKQFPKVKENMFVAEKTAVESLRRLFGQCVLEPKLEVISEFQHIPANSGSIKAMVSTDQSAWVATYQGTEIKHVDKTGHVDRALAFTSHVSDIAVTEDGGLLVTPNGGYDAYKVWKVQPNRKIVTFVDMEPLRPYCICTSNTGHIYVGCLDDVNYDVTDKNTRSVIKLSSTGVVKQRWQYDDNGQRLFTLPEKLQENTNGDIWVRDRTSNNKGRVIVIQGTGKLRFIYTGFKNDKITEDFYPDDITSTGNGTMLISDANNDIIHAVDENGALLYFLGSRHITGIYGPTSMSFDRKHNQLWIGNIEGQVQVLRFV